MFSSHLNRFLFRFIDDVLVNEHSETGLREAASRVSKALDNLSLKCNSDKTALINMESEKLSCGKGLLKKISDICVETGEWRVFPMSQLKREAGQR